jgi:DNA-binding transcriptional ArsR family regulator
MESVAEKRNVPDVETLRAVAHPIRSRILGLLRYEGPATASELGRRIEESSGSASYHLRQLARFGFVEEDPQQPNRRDKRWRATHAMTSWSRAELSADPEGREVSDAFERRQILVALDRFQRWFAGRAGRDPRWDEAGGAYDDLLRLTPAQLESLKAELDTVFARYRTHPRPKAKPGDEPAHVSVYLHLLPFEELPL